MTEKVKRLRLNNDIRKNALGVIKDFYESKKSQTVLLNLGWEF